MSINNSVSTGTLELARFIRDLLEFNEQQIKIGRTNFERSDFTEDFIVPDEISTAIEVLPKDFNSTTEILSQGTQIKGQYTIDFYGDNAYTNAVKFTVLSNSQKGYELQRDMGITVFSVTTITDLKELTDTQYSPRYQLALNLRYNESVNVPTLRLDEAPTSIFSN